MPVLPLSISAAATAALLAWAAHLGFDPEPFAAGSAAILAVTLAGSAVLLPSAVLVSRARWARPAVGITGATGLALAAVTAVDPGTIVAAILSGLALAGAVGPWLSRWLRRLPGAESPPRSAAASLGALAVLPAVVAVIRYQGLGAVEWVLIATAAATGLALSRAWVAGLWLARLAVPIAGVAAGVAAGWPWGLAVGAAAVAAAVPAWMPDLVFSIRPILPSRGNAPIPPELVDPELLRAAGYDDRGRS